ncbi:hypothetical protein EDEG_03675 [Edhazardia aedis USNM 41457]|uniref:Transmembrane adaptor Erv26 n=1 Tax=Edhazardia aedis (strain USNM 41457) TaxID=1003232 RepID=J9D1V8_EDHAE|nr:hypothetical protein EDEG_03675 [Edhazardia aedis USNM 41457]|eukprot:EJW01846.1 hypothetical protein EDEG_03675 [Edhazardia aedis USNM 41457]
MAFLNILGGLLVFVTCIAALLAMAVGLYKAVEYIEDRTYAAKKKIEQIIIAISVAHIILLFRRVGFFIVIYSLVIQYIFYSLLEIYPYVQPTNLTFIVGSLMALGNHFLILRAMILNNNYLLEMIFAFLVFVWATPFCFFLSLSANDEAFPTTGKKNSTLIGKFIKRAFNQ